LFLVFCAQNTRNKQKASELSCALFSPRVFFFHMQQFEMAEKKLILFAKKGKANK